MHIYSGLRSYLIMKLQNHDTEERIINDLIYQNIIEKRRSRRWGIFFKLISMLIIGIIVILIINCNENKYFHNKNVDHVAIIDINDIISDKSHVNAKNIINALNEAFDNKNAKAIIIKINSAGGTPVQANIIHNHVKRLRKINNDKPIFSVIEDIGTSGAYLIAVAAEKIYCDPSSIVGSIGAVLNSFGFTESMNKLGIERRIYKSGKYKMTMDPFSERNTEDEQSIQHNLNIVHKNFINVVKKNRNNLKYNNTDLFSGKIWIGKDALELGLVDGFYDIYTLSSDIIKINTIIDYNTNTNIFNIFKW